MFLHQRLHHLHQSVSQTINVAKVELALTLIVHLYVVQVIVVSMHDALPKNIGQAALVYLDTKAMPIQDVIQVGIIFGFLLKLSIVFFNNKLKEQYKK